MWESAGSQEKTDEARLRDSKMRDPTAGVKKIK